MPQSLSAVYIHLIFSTKERYPYLRDQTLQMIYTHISAESPKNSTVPR